MYHLSFFGTTYITLKAHNSKHFRSIISPKYALKNCVFYHAFDAVSMPIITLFGETMMSSYAWIPQSLVVLTRDTFKIEHIKYPTYAILRKFTRKGGGGLRSKRYQRCDHPHWTVQIWTVAGVIHIKFTDLRLAKLSHTLAKCVKLCYVILYIMMCKRRQTWLFHIIVCGNYWLTRR